MALDDLLDELSRVNYSPRTLEFDLATTLGLRLSVSACAFIEIAFGKTVLTIDELTGDKWKSDPEALSFFFSCTPDTRIEILAFLTSPIHEMTHRVDFLISPFGLQYYAHSLREYWCLQEFVPEILDNRETINRMRFLAGYSEPPGEPGSHNSMLSQIWKVLGGIINDSYAWGDVSNIQPLRKYVEDGWGEKMKGEFAPFGVRIAMEPITVLKYFQTFRVAGSDGSWYLRPLTIFETKAIVNSLLYILHMLGERGSEACLQFFERIYLQRKTSLPEDYFFLLDVGARFCGSPDFHSLLKQKNFGMLRTILILLSTACWYAIQAPPFLKGEDSRVANPILRLCACFQFISSWMRGKEGVSFNSIQEGLLILDGTETARSLSVKPIKETLPVCRKLLDGLIESNEKLTWHPDVKAHFRHIFSLMRPHFNHRDDSYDSHMGMPLAGNPQFGCQIPTDWDLTFDYDYRISAPAKEWFDLRTDLLFNLLKPSAEIVKRVGAHFEAALVFSLCPCLKTVPRQWVSRHAKVFTLHCAACGKSRTISREDAHEFNFKTDDE